MKKSLYILIAFILIVLAIGISTISSYNSIITKEEEIDNKFADIEVQLERRAELIPNLVNTVKGYTSHETKALEKVTTSREKLINATTTEDKIKANNDLTNAINNLYLVVENYPDLKASTNFTQLQDELAGTENRIAIARKDYNTAVKDYNKTIKRFPQNIIAGLFNFESKDYFEAKESSTEVPNVSFQD